MKLPIAYTIPKPSIAESGSHIVIVLPLRVDGGYVIGSPLRAPGGTLLALFSVVRVIVITLVVLLVPGGRWALVCCVPALYGHFLLALALYSLVKKKKKSSTSAQLASSAGFQEVVFPCDETRCLVRKPWTCRGLAGCVCCSIVFTDFTEKMSRRKCPHSGQLFWFVGPLTTTRAHLCFARRLLCCYKGYACCDCDWQMRLVVRQALCRKERDALHGGVNPEGGNVWAARI
uniref:Uncharacterized protein n=1 Tax=Rhipicephalus appendiculatus TaxID=34631 RepID=A0A131YBQ3_RHIAP